MKKPDLLKSILLGVIALVSAITLPNAQAETITWNGWTFEYEVGFYNDGLALKNVHYQNHSLFKRVSLPAVEGTYTIIPPADFDASSCDIGFFYRFNSMLTPIPWANNANISRREFSMGGREWYEIGIYKTLQGREYFQAFYLSKDGLFDAHLYERGGWLCPEREGRFIYWRVDADIDGADSDVIEFIDSQHANFYPRTMEYAEQIFSYDDLLKYAFRFRDIVSNSSASLSLAGLNFTHPDGNWTQSPRIAPRSPLFEPGKMYGVLEGLIAKENESEITFAFVEPEDLYGKDVAGRFIGELTPVQEYHENPGAFSQDTWFTNSILIIPSWAYSLPDVIVDEVRYDRAYTPTAAGALGNLGCFTVTIRNLGAATPVDKTVGVGLYIDGVYKTYVAVKSLRPGEIRTLTTTDLTRYIIPGGVHTITAKIDDLNRFAESIENNNTLSIPVSIPNGPLIKINSPLNSATVSGASVVLSARSTDTVGIKGGVNFYIDGQFIGNKWTSPYNLTWDSRNAAEGWHSFAVTATGTSLASSGANTVFKVTPDNNSFPPDIVVTSLQYANGEFTCTIKNIGTGAVPANAWLGLAYSVDNAYKTWTASYGPLAAGESKTLAMLGATFIMPSGTHAIKVIADDQSSIAEANESNNVLSQVITVP
jgi:CARDB/Bacterial Ig domain